MLVTCERCGHEWDWKGKGIELAEKLEKTDPTLKLNLVAKCAQCQWLNKPYRKMK